MEDLSKNETVRGISDNLWILSESHSHFGRRSGLMVSALDSGAIGPGSGPGRGHCVVFLARHFTLTVPLSTQVYKWVPANLMLGVALRGTSIPSRGE